MALPLTYSIWARLQALYHITAGHDVGWKVTYGNDLGCAGDIVCNTCQELIWCRALDPWRKPKKG